MKITLFLIQAIVQFAFCNPYTWAEIDNIQHGQQDLFSSSPAHIFNDGTSGDRNKNFVIVFATAFSAAPQVAVGINKIKCQQNSLFNIDIQVVSTRIDSFTLQVRVKSSQQCDFLSINYISVPTTETRIAILYFFFQITDQSVSDQLGPNRLFALPLVLTANAINIPILSGFQIVINDSTQIQLSLGLSQDNTKFIVSTGDNNQVKYISGFQITIWNTNNTDYGIQVFQSLAGSSIASVYTTPVLNIGSQNIIPFFSYNSFNFDRSYPLYLQQGLVQVQNNQYIFTYGPNSPSLMYQYSLVYFNAKYKQCSPLSKYLFNEEYCLTQCPQSYYPNDLQNTCLQCHPSCLTCSNSDKINSCTSCSINKNLDNGRCICQAGYYQNLNDPSYNCNKCSYLCQECHSNSDTCTKCSLSRFLDGTVCKCQNGYWDSKSSAFCPKCFRNCKTCNGGLSNNCLSCNSGYYLYSDGSCTCDYGYYDDPVQNTCQKCHSSCGQCNGPLDINCTQCPSNRILQFNKCVCANGLVEQMLNGVLSCIVNQSSSCLPNCKLCSYQQIGNLDNPSLQVVPQCLQCQNNLVLVNGQCQCTDGTYLVDNQICFPCEKTCKTCYKGGVYGCLSCFDYYKIQNDHSCRNSVQESSQSNSKNLAVYISLLAVLVTIVVVSSFVYFHKKFEQRKTKYKNELSQVNQDKITVKQHQKDRKRLNLQSNIENEQQQINIHNYIFDEIDDEYNPAAEDQLEQHSQQVFNNADQQQEAEPDEIKQDSEEKEKNQIEDLENRSSEKVKSDGENEVVIDLNKEN
ncbi:hypothetical protein ABPG74_010820 [Tetrahymena malaccensis]